MGSLPAFTMTILTQTIGMLVDGMVIANFFGVECTAAYGMTLPVFTLFTAIAGVFSAGIQTRCGSSMGKGDIDKSNAIFSAAAAASFAAACVLMLILNVFMTQICSALGASPGSGKLFPLVRDYFRGLTLGLPAIFVSTALAAVMQLDGDKNRPILSTLIMTAFNVAGDLVNVFAFNGGMFGMALATSISYYISVLVLWLHFLKKDAFFRLSFGNLKNGELYRTVVMGLPDAVTRGGKPLSSLFLNLILLEIAQSTSVAAYSVQSSIFNLFGSVGAAVGISTMIIAGICYGEEDSVAAGKLLKISLGFTIVLNVIISAVVFVFAPLFVSMFLKDPAVTKQAVRCVRFFALGKPISKINVVFMKYLQGMRHIKLANVLGVLDSLVYPIPLAAILGRLGGTDGVWLAFILRELLVTFTVIALAAWHNRKLPRRIEDMLFLPEGFGVPPEDRYDVSVTTMEQVTKVSETAQSFCMTKGHYDKRATAVALCVEEIAGNIVSHGFSDGKRHCIDLRILKKNGDFIIRIRDDCRAFNPKERMELLDPKDHESNIGLRIVFRLAEDVTYTNTMNMNNLIIRV